MYVFKIHVRAYFNQQFSVGIYTDQIHLQLFETLIFHDSETINYRYIILVWRVSQMDEHANSVT